MSSTTTASLIGRYRESSGSPGVLASSKLIFALSRCGLAMAMCKGCLVGSALGNDFFRLNR